MMAITYFMNNPWWDQPPFWFLLFIVLSPILIVCAQAAAISQSEYVEAAVREKLAADERRPSATRGASRRNCVN